MPKFAVAVSDFDNMLEIHFFDCSDEEEAYRLGLLAVGGDDLDESKLPEGIDEMVQFAADMDCNIVAALIP